MYKLTILFSFLTLYSSIGLMDSYKIAFNTENASYTLQIHNGEFVFDDNQPNVTVTYMGDNSADTDKPPLDSTQGKFYKITKGATWQQGLKIGAIDIGDVAGIIGEEDISDIIGREIGEEDIGDAAGKIGEEDISDDVGKIGEEDIGDDLGIIGEIDWGDPVGREIGGVFDSENLIILSFEFVAVLDQKIEIPERGLLVYIKGDKFVLFK